MSPTFFVIDKSGKAVLFQTVRQVLPIGQHQSPTSYLLPAASSSSFPHNRRATGTVPLFSTTTLFRSAATRRGVPRNTSGNSSLLQRFQADRGKSAASRRPVSHRRTPAPHFARFRPWPHCGFPYRKRASSAPDRSGRRPGKTAVSLLRKAKVAGQDTVVDLLKEESCRVCAS